MNYKPLLSWIITFLLLSILINFKFAAVFILAVGIHEYGHIYVARKFGIATSGFYLFPFIGGVAILNDKPKSFYHHALIALAGPAFGMALGILFHLIYLYFINFNPLANDFALAAKWIYLMNLFNLLPLAFLDGGRILDSITFSTNKYFGIISSVISYLVGIVFIWQFNPIISLLIAISMIPFISLLWSKKSREELYSLSFNLKKLTIKESVIVCILYVLLILMMVSGNSFLPLGLKFK